MVLRDRDWGAYTGEGDALGLDGDHVEEALNLGFHVIRLRIQHVAG